MAGGAVYTIGELADAAGVTARTIRYYTAEGLLPPPDTRGRYALYGEEHLLRLQLIARLKEAFLPLHEIRARLDRLDPNQMRQLLEERAEPQPAAGDAADYIAQVLSSRAPPPGAPPAGVAVPGQAAAHTLHAPGPEAAAAREPGRLPMPAAPLPAGRAEPVQAPAPGPRSRSLLSRLIPARQDAAAPAAQVEEAEQWQRVTLAPGVELHIRAPLTTTRRAQVERLIAQARELFEDTSGRPQ